MVLTEAFAAGTPAIASAIAGYSDVVTDGVDGVLVPPADPQRLAEELQRAHHEPERLRGDGRGRARAAPSATPGRTSPTASPRSTSGRSRRRAPVTGPNDSRTGPVCDPPTGAARRPPQTPPLARPAAGAERQRGRRIARRVGLGVAGALGVGLTVLAAQQDRRRQRGRKHRPLRRHLGADRLRPDVALALLPRRLLVLDRPRGAAQPPGPAPRRHLGDDDRRADVGDAAGPPRRAGARHVPGPPDRPHAGDVPGPARHPRLADAAQHRRPGAARRDHRLDHRPLPLQHPEALRLQLRAAGCC